MDTHTETFDPRQLTIFPRARRTDPRTSHDAAASVNDVATGQRARILAELTEPMTADELDALIGWRITTAGRRLPELAELGKVKRLERTRRTRSGRQAHLWART